MKLEDVTYITSGKFISNVPWTHPARIIDSCEIIFVIKNGFSIQEGDHQYDLSTNDILILDKNTPHNGVGMQSDTCFFWVHFPARPDDIHLPKHFKVTAPSNIIMLFRQLIHYSNSKEYPITAVNLILRLLLLEINVQYIQNGNRKQLSMINEVCEWIRINTHKGITASDVAEYFHYNKDYLSRLLKKSNLPGLQQLIIQEKLNRARYLLLSTDLPIKDIASKVGYENYIDFLKFYKFHEGISPTTLRNLYNNTHLNNH